MPQGHGYLQQAFELLLDSLSGVVERTVVTLGASTAWDLVYAIYMLVAGDFLAGGKPMHLVGSYYLSLAILSAVLPAGLSRPKDLPSPRARLRRPALVALAAGVMLLGVNATVAGLVGRLSMGWMDRGVGMVRFSVMALYSAVALYLAVSGWRRYGSHPSPIIVAAKGVSLCKVEMTILFLMLTAAYTFGGKDGSPVEFLVDITARYLGWLVAVMTFTIAVWTIGKNVRVLLRMRRDGGTDDDAT